MRSIKLTSPDGSPVVIILGIETAVVVPKQFKPAGEFLVGKTEMLEGSRIMVGPRLVDVLETVEQVTSKIEG